MLSYQHAYHAGNHADVLKHAVLACCLEWLNRKPGAWSYYDTHAGEGLYNLDGALSSRHKEWLSGLGRLSFKEADPSPFLASYFQALGAWHSRSVSYYPGSPAIAAHFQREGDRLICCERHPGAYRALRQAMKSEFGTQAAIEVHERDGYEGVMALLPPPTGRGLVLIDPSYELKEDYHRIPLWIAKGLKKWRQMTALIWYPILADERQKDLVAAFLEAESAKSASVCCLELRLHEAPDRGLQGSGMLVVNPPWGLQSQMPQGLDDLAARLGAEGSYRELGLG